MKMIKKINVFHWLNAILLGSAFVYSCGFFLLNVFVPFDYIGMKMYNGVSANALRVSILQTLETILNTGTLVYFIAAIILLWQLYLKNAVPNTSIIIKKFIVLMLCLSLCTLPFGFIHSDWLVNYMLPLTNSSGKLLILTVIACILSYRRKCRM